MLTLEHAQKKEDKGNALLRDVVGGDRYDGDSTLVCRLRET